jgi:hypothetical protein
MNMLPASAWCSLAHIRTPSTEHQQVVQFQLETMEAVVKGALVARVGEQVCTNWWCLRQGAGILKEDARQAGLREEVALSDQLCEMADHALPGLASVGLAAELVTVEGEESCWWIGM